MREIKKKNYSMKAELKEEYDYVILGSNFENSVLAGYSMDFESIIVQSIISNWKARNPDRQSKFSGFVDIICRTPILAQTMQRFAFQN